MCQTYEFLTNVNYDVYNGPALNYYKMITHNYGLDLY